MILEDSYPVRNKVIFSNELFTITYHFTTNSIYM